MDNQITNPKFAERTEWELRPNRFAQALAAHRTAGRELLDLTASNPPAAALAYNTDAILSAFANPQSLEYHPEPKGLLCAREAVAEYYAEVADRTANSTAPRIDPKQIVLTTSTSEAYTYAFRLLCDPGDEVLIPTPSYPLFEYLAELQDVNLVPYPLLYDHGWQIDFYALQKAVGPRTRAIIFVNPNNPTGSYISESERRQLNRICAEHGLALIIDEVFLDYSFEQPRSSFAFNEESLTITLSGISKISGLPQMKLAWMVVSGPESLASDAMARLEVIADTYLSMNAPIQLAAPALLAQRVSIREQLLTRAHANLRDLDRQLTDTSVSRLNAQGGWYALLRVPRVESDEDLVIRLLEETNVLVQPGYFYDFPGDGYIVVSLITPESIFSEGIKRMLQHIR